METKDTLLEAFRNAAERQQPTPFHGMDNVWYQIENKLDERDAGKIIPLWKKCLFAATILIILGIGGFILYNTIKQKDNMVKNTPSTTIPNNIDTLKKSIPKTIDKSIVAKTAKRIKKHTYTPLIIAHNTRPTAIPEARKMAETIAPASIATNQQNSLDEVVVVRYGTEKRKEITGNTAMTNPTNTLNYDVASNAYNNIRARSILEPSTMSNALQGRVAGLSMNQKGMSLPTTGMRLRGIQSFRKDANPLYIVNGKVMENASLNNINPNDITHIEVLKDASATAIYGSKAANGVILITTKNPKAFEPTKDQESYETYKENGYASPVTNPFSTFSIDVDNASYTNIRRFINNGQPVPKDAVRVEEMVNFFKYHTPQPTDGTPYAIQSEYGIAPWNPRHHILKISLQGKVVPEENIPASNIVFLIDVSGSMDAPNKLPLLKASMKLLVNKLRSQDKVAIVTYSGNAGLALAPTSGSQKNAINKAIDSLSAGGSTAGGEGIELAYKTAQEHFIQNGNNRVVLATDGDFNVGISSDSELEDLITEKRKSQIFLTCLGFGMGNYKDSKMQTLAQKGNGNYAYIDNIQEANRVLVKEFGGTMFTIAKDVKLQVEFNPAQVRAYRLIGYETRLLADQDFPNDSIDAGEMGSGHTVTALYEIIPSNVKNDSLFNAPTEPRYLQPQKNSTSDELAFIKTRYKLPNSNKSIEKTITVKPNAEKESNVSQDYRLATTVAWFGLKLRDSKLLPTKSTKDILNWGKATQYDDPDGYVAELFRLIETQ
ncbi:MAG: von Willebrand factor type A domain-containing protein [Chitinophagaceae bacterium]